MADETVAPEGSTAVATLAPGMLIPAELLGESKHASEALFEGMAGGGYLPRIQLNASNSRLVQKRKCEVNTYVLVRGKDSIVKDYGGEFHCLVLGWRPKATFFDDNSAKNYFNPRHPEFKAIEEKANMKAPRPRGYLCGPEYLLYLPDVNQIALFHMNNPTMRLRAGDMKALIGKAATLRVEEIEKNSNIWPGPIITEATTPLRLPFHGSEEQKELWERIKVQKEKFCNPPEQEDEVVTEETASDAAPATDRPR